MVLKENKDTLALHVDHLFHKTPNAKHVHCTSLSALLLSLSVLPLSTALLIHTANAVRLRLHYKYSGERWTLPAVLTLVYQWSPSCLLLRFFFLCYTTVFKQLLVGDTPPCGVIFVLLVTSFR